MTKEIVLFSIYGLAHLLVIVTLPKESYLYLPSKIIPILILIFSLAREWKNLQKRGKTVLFALGFSVFGDSFLALPGAGYFVPGLGSFLVAQLIYAYAFSIGSKLKIVLFIPFLIFGITFFYFLIPHLGALLAPVAVYISAICLMGWRAAAREANSRVFIRGFIGALIFILSDSIIAYSMFLNPSLDRQLASIMIMITYYVAQALIYEASKLEELSAKST